MKVVAKKVKCLLLATSLLLLLTEAARAEGFPAQPIRIYVGFSAGGSGDMIARAIASVASKFLGQPMVVINKPGASGTLAAREVANSEPDGYTLLLAGGSETTCVGNFRKLSYDPIGAFNPVLRIVRLRLILTVSADAPWTTLADFVEDARMNPGKYIYASAGYGSLAHATMVLLAKRTGLVLKHLPYTSGAQGLLALKGGHVQITVASENEIRSLSEALQIRSLALASPDRSPLMPDIPTVRELGYDLSIENQKGLVAPSGTPEQRITFLNTALKQAFDDPAFVALCERLNFERAYLGPEDFRQALQDMYSQIGDAIKR